jgi:hypothetical protein
MGRETERIHFPNSRLHDSNNRQEQQNLYVCRHTTNNGGCNLTRNAINWSIKNNINNNNINNNNIKITCSNHIGKNKLDNQKVWCVIIP